MKSKMIALAAVAAGLVGVSAGAAKWEAPAGGPPGSWTLIGTTHAQHMNDHDSIALTGPGNHFHSIRLKVTGAPLHMQRMRVTYGNGAPEEIPLRFNFKQGSMSRVIDLRGGERAISRVDFWYDTKGWFKGTADVSLYGMH